MGLVRFVWVVQAALSALLSKILAMLDRSPAEDREPVYDDLVDLCGRLKAVYGLLTTLICQVRRIHFLLLSKFYFVKIRQPDPRNNVLLDICQLIEEPLAPITDLAMLALTPSKHTGECHLVPPSSDI